MVYDLIIIGGGAAGLSAAQYARMHNLSVLVVEELAPGGQALNIVKLENIPGCEPSTGIEWSEQLEETTLSLGAELLTSTASAILLEGNNFKVETQKGTLIGSQVIVATGTAAKTPDFPGAQEYAGHGISYCAPCDGPFFRGKPVAVLGGGDSACEEALFLSEICSHVTIITQEGQLTAQPVYQTQLQKKENVKILFNTSIKKAGGVTNAMGLKTLTFILTSKNSNPANSDGEELLVSGLFILIGGRPRTELVSSFPGISFNEDGFILSDNWCETGVPGIFAIGSVRENLFSQIAVHIADGVLAARKVYINRCKRIETGD